MAVVRPPARFGSTLVEGHRASSFDEKPQATEGLINSGFFVLSPRVLSLIEVTGPLVAPTAQTARYYGRTRRLAPRSFRQPMDTLRERSS